MKRSQRYYRALMEGYNLAGVAGSVLLSAVSHNLLPVLVGGVAEIGYLLFVPDSQWYRNRVERAASQGGERQRIAAKSEILPALAPSAQQTYQRLEAKRQQIARDAPKDQASFPEVLKKLDYLLQEYLSFAFKEVQYRQYLQSLFAELYGRQTNPLSPLYSDRPVKQLVADIDASYQRDLAKLRNDSVEQVSSVQAQRIKIIERRQELLRRTRGIVEDMQEQMLLIEETFGLINDEIRVRTPAQILTDIEEVVTTTTNTTEAVRELDEMNQTLTARQ